MSTLIVDTIRNTTLGATEVTVGDSESGEFINLGASTMVDGAMLGTNMRHISISMSTENVALESDSEHAMVSLHIPYAFTLTKVKIGLSASNGNIGHVPMIVTFGDDISSVPDISIAQGFGSLTPISSGTLNIPLAAGAVVSADLDLTQVNAIGGAGMKLYLIGNVT